MVRTNRCPETPAPITRTSLRAACCGEVDENRCSLSARIDNRLPKTNRIERRHSPRTTEWGSTGGTARGMGITSGKEEIRCAFEIAIASEGEV
jgi:hypothetical protein